ncbi:MAG: hypothetical protein WBF02_06930, partial [Xanthobacteraceae bacterium]
PLIGSNIAREGHKRKKPATARRCGLASLLNLRLDISGLLMDSNRFRQPRPALSCINLLNGGGVAPRSALPRLF